MSKDKIYDHYVRPVHRHNRHQINATDPGALIEVCGSDKILWACYDDLVASREPEIRVEKEKG